MTEITACRSCGAPIVWAETVKGKQMPLDMVPAIDGTLVYVGNGTSQVRYIKVHDDISTPRFTSHFATCPQAKEWRKR